MTKLPRVECPACTRAIAAGPVAGRLTKGRLWRHDAPGARRGPDGTLVSCAGSLAIVDLPTTGVQLEIHVEVPPPTSPDDSTALF